MHTGQIVFSQLMKLLPLPEFHKCVDRYSGDYKVQKFSCLDQFFCMAFAQLTYRESLRDIESCLRAMPTLLYHMGIRGKVSRSTLAYANETRDWHIYADFAQVLIEIARPLYLNDDFGVQLKQTAYAFDSTTIDLCLSLFPWAKFRKTKAAIKLHTLLNLRGSIPEFIHITKGVVHDVNIMDMLIIEPGVFLRYGPRLYGFCKALRHTSIFRFLRNKSKAKSCGQTSLFTASGQVYRATLRPNRRSHWYQHRKGLSRTITPYFLLRCRY